MQINWAQILLIIHHQFIWNCVQEVIDNIDHLVLDGNSKLEKREKAETSCHFGLEHFRKHQTSTVNGNYTRNKRLTCAQHSASIRDKLMSKGLEYYCLPLNGRGMWFPYHITNICHGAHNQITSPFECPPHYLLHLPKPATIFNLTHPCSPSNHISR